MFKNSRLFIATIGMVVLISLSAIVTVFVLPYFSKTNNIYITNQTSSAATIVWTTQHAVVGKIKVSDNSDFDNEKIFLDDRNVEEISMGVYKAKSQKKRQVHHVTIRQLDADKKYYFKIINNGIEADVDTNEFSTSKIAEFIQEPNPVYGKLEDDDKNRVDEGVVIYEKYADSTKSQKLSTVINNGSYSLESGNILDSELKKIFNFENYKQNLTILATTDGIYKKETTIDNDRDQPADTIILSKEINELADEYLIQITNEFEGKTETYKESCTKDGKKGEREVTKICGAGSTAASGSGCKWGGGTVGECIVKEETVSDPIEEQHDQQQNNNVGNTNSYEGKIEKYDEPCEKDGKKGVKHVTKVCGQGSTAASGSGCSWGPGSYASECIVADEQATGTITPVPVITSTPVAVASGASTQPNCGSTRTTTISGNCVNDVCTDGKTCGNITCGKCTCGGGNINPGETCRITQTGIPTVQPSSTPKASTTPVPSATPIPVTSQQTIQFLQTLFSSIKASPESLTGNTDTTSSQNNKFNVSFTSNIVAKPIPSTTYTANNTNQTNNTNNGSSLLQEQDSVKGDVYNSVLNMATHAGFTNLNVALETTVTALNATSLTNNEKAICMGAAVSNSNIEGKCQEIFSNMDGTTTKAVTDVVNALRRTENISVMNMDTASVTDVIKSAAEYIGVGTGLNSEAQGAEAIRQEIVEETQFPVVIARYLDTQQGQVVPSVIVGEGTFGDNGFLAQSYLYNLTRGVSEDEARNLVEYVEKVTGKDLKIALDDTNALTELAGAVGEINRRGGFNKQVTDGDGNIFPFDRNAHSNEVLEVVDEFTQVVTDYVNPDEEQLTSHEAEWALYTNLDAQNYDNAVGFFGQELKNLAVEKYVKGETLQDIVGSVGDYLIGTLNESEQIDDRGIVTVLAEDTGIESGVYQLTGDQLTTKEVNIIDGQGIVYFFDRNKNGTKENDEPYYDGSVYSLDVKFNKVMDVQSYKMKAGWNLITIPMLMKEEGTSKIEKASEFLQRLNENGASVTHITTYRSNKFITYSARLDQDGVLNTYGEDYNILPGEAYFVKSLSNIDISLKGNKIIGGQEIMLENGWNLTGIYNSDKLAYKGFEVLKQMNTGGIEADILSRWQEGNYQNIILQNNIQYGNDFSVYPNEGYFIRVKNRGSGKFKPI